MLAPGLVNLLLCTPGLGEALKTVAGFTTEREPPAFAAESFQSWFQHQPKITDGGRRPVVLWPDTFNNYFFPDTAKAAVRVLEAAGYRVSVPQAPLCCGRPLYDYGMLDLAKRHLLQVIEVLRPGSRAGMPIVGLEPSCLSVFRDELRDVLPDDEDAQRLACQSKTLSELLLATPGWKPSKLAAKALVQTHCHHKAVLDPEKQHEMFEKIGLKLQPNPTGCCGHAGAFGYEAEHITRCR